MPYVVDTRVLRRAGDLLAEGDGTFRRSDVHRLLELIKPSAADPVTVPGSAAMLVVHATVGHRADKQACELLAGLASAVREDAPSMASWVAGAFAAPVLRSHPLRLLRRPHHLQRVWRVGTRLMSLSRTRLPSAARARAGSPRPGQRESPCRS